MKLQKLLLIPIVCFALLANAQAVVPPPDGGYPGFNTAEGANALFNLTTGSANTAVGWFSLFSNTDGSFNTATGAGALLFNTANQNTAFGTAALLFNTTGQSNTGVGSAALLNNTTGDSNTATGARALTSNTTGHSNTANGSGALQSNTEGDNNTANGVQALAVNTIGSQNTAIGTGALFANNDEMNTAIGFQSLFSNTTGNRNTAIGATALYSNTTGSRNTAVGDFPLQSNTTGYDNIALGFSAGSSVTTANNVICIGSNVAGANVSNSCFIGHIRLVTTAQNNAIPVLIDASGQLGTTSSSCRFKKEIKPMDKTSEAILALKPVTFHYKADKTNRPEFGLIAEEVAKVNPDLVVRAENGEIYTVRYDAVNAMLLNEFLKEHRKIEQQERKLEEQAATITQLESNAAKQEIAIAQQRNDFQATTAQQQKEMQLLRQQLNHQAAQIQRVTADLEMRGSTPGSQVVVNRP